MNKESFFTFGHCNIINALWEVGCVKGATNDLTQRKENVMDVGQFDWHHMQFLSDTSKEWNQKSFNNLLKGMTNMELRMANAMVDTSNAMYVPTNYFDGDPGLEAAMRETRETKLRQIITVSREASNT